MGHNIHTMSDIEVYASLGKKVTNEEEAVYTCKSNLDRRYFWFIEECMLNGKNSILFQLEALSTLPMVWLAEIKYVDHLNKNPTEKDMFNTDESISRLLATTKWLNKKIPLNQKLKFDLTMSVVNQEYYPKYVQEGEFQEDLQKLIDTLTCYQKAGSKSFMMCWG